MKRANLKIAFLLFSLSLFNTTLQAQQWNALGEGLGIGAASINPPIYSSVRALIADSGYIYAGGTFDPTAIARWNGNSWSSVGGETTHSFAMYNGKLYAGNSFWNGTEWIPVGSGEGIIFSLVVYNSHLIAAGLPNQLQGNFIDSLGDSTWSPIANGSSYSLYNSMVVYNGKLIVGGSFDSIGGIAANNIAAWDGNKWTTLGSGINYNYAGQLNALTVMGGNLYAAGESGFLAKWNDTSWAIISENMIRGSIYALANNNGNIIVGGNFDSIGGIAANNIAEWDGNSWSAFGKGVVGQVDCILANDGDIYIGGTFDSAGGIPVNNIARWGFATGINNITETNKTTIYPNPGNGILNIAFENITESCQVDIYNLLGEKIYHSYLNSSNTTFDIGKQPGGAYLYRVYKNDGTLVSSGKYILE